MASAGFLVEEFIYNANKRITITSKYETLKFSTNTVKWFRIRVREGMGDAECMEDYSLDRKLKMTSVQVKIQIYYLKKHEISSDLSRNY